VVGAYVLDSRYGLDQGFDFYDDDFSSAPAPLKFGYAERNAGAVTDAALGWLDQAEASAFFLWVHYFDPHMPYETPGYDRATATVAPYDAEIAYADSQLQRLLQRNSEIEQATGRHTIIVITGDHGESLWEHGEPTHGFFAYNATLRVPLIVVLPSASERGIAIETPVSLVDIYPSVLHWLGLPSPYPVDGFLLPTSSAQVKPVVGSGRPLYFETSTPRLSYGWSGLEGVIVEDQKYIAAPRPELYDLASDPGETQNLFEPGAPRALALQRKLRDLKHSKRQRTQLAPKLLDADDENTRRLRALGYLGGSELLPSGSSIDPKDQIDLHRRVLAAQVEISLENFTGGAELLREILLDDPDNARALFLLLDLANVREARAETTRILEERMAKPLSPPFDRLLPFSVAVFRSEAERWSEAEAALRIALEADPNDPATQFQLARTLRAQGGRREEALQRLTFAHRSDSANLEYASVLVELAEELGDLSVALEASQRILEENPDHPLALNNAAWMNYRTQTHPELALARIQQAVSLDPGKPHFQHTYGCVLLWMDRAADALPHFLSTLEAAPQHAEAHYHLGIARLATGDPDGASVALAEAIKLATQPSPWWFADAESKRARLHGL
jgi:tetratricopeptide (TPR) repeat protein